MLRDEQRLLARLDGLVQHYGELAEAWARYTEALDDCDAEFAERIAKRYDDLQVD